ncbi:uncharacterized protein EDB93DRAFT_1250366 [Suillus bovinus]|uniref:uncharacterized protein n=1 Tax=Suillus bovinus TaxID=48563 RepID=UPI001B8844CA|nr:uncharacterized protein EDB93DRAFT_1250366 [Suillus bovinus]KAG2147860.1 hypothetical protein EDB93DRAFT_1250366 [Suillus bovinus]
MSTAGYTCACKRTFTVQNYFNYHRRSCSQTKKHLSSAISSFKELLTGRKKPRIEVGPVTGSLHIPSSDHLASGHVVPSTSSHLEVTVVSLPDPSIATEGVGGPPEGEGPQNDIEDMSLAQRQTRHQNRQMPLRFRDVLPQPLPVILLEARDRHLVPVVSVVISNNPSALPVRTVLCTPQNVFGLVRQYFSSEVPSHDPEQYVTIVDLSLIQGSPQVNNDEHVPLSASSKSQYHPYPNCSSFELGNWYWNQGVQKSQEDYMKLMKIMGASTFKATDVCSTHWKKINSQLGANDYDKGGGEEWEDEDTRWKISPVSIEVPFARTAEVPGSRCYHAAELYHCSLVGVLREKLANARDDKLFHYEPYQLHWNSPHLDAKVSIYGDLYTSAAFHKAHSNLQESPGEPGCDLPRVVAALMFWSDAMQLTSFGNAKLWPTYMYFGNESKYRRCKPSLNLSNHVAYFETVRLPTLFDMVHT